MESIEIFNHAERVELIPAGKVLFEQGDPAEFMYAVVEGQLEVSVNGKVVSAVSSGAIVGEMAIIDRERRPRTATVRAVSDSRVVPIDEAEFKRLVHRVPFFALQMLRIVADRLRQADALL